MRILYLTEESISFSSALVRGGAIHVRNVVMGLRERGHDVHLIDWNEKAEFEFQHPVTPRTRFVDGALRTVRKALAVGRAVDPDVVISKTRKTYLAGLVVARSLGVPHVVHVGSSLDRPTDGVIDQIDNASFTTRLRLGHDGYFVVCEHIAAGLRRRGVEADRIYDVKNAVDTDRFHPATVPVPLDSVYRRHLDGLPEDRIRLGFIGGLHPYKGVRDLEAALSRTDAECRLIVAGEGPDRTLLERRCGERAVFLGAVPYEQIPALYHEMDVLVVPSHTEGLPRVVLEAQATGTPVVATNVGGIPEVVSDGETGLLCEPHRPDLLATAIDRLADDPRERERLGSNGRDAVVATYTWEAVYDRYERYLAQIVGR